jgi:hypothetical protein
MLLREAGYKVVTAMGNQAGTKKAKAGKFDLFIVGHGDLTEQLEMMHYLKQHYPRKPVLALRRSRYQRLNDADCVADVDEPKEWLEGVEDCLELRR